MPKVSVIMGVYNCKNKEMLLKSVKSVVNQTFTDWEFIICNDGSSNDTLEMLQEIEKIDSRIKIISYEQNHGLNYALNECLKVASGEFIARQDDDDISDENRFRKEMEFLLSHEKYAFVGCIADIYDDKGVWGEYRLDEKPDNNSFLWNSPFMHPTIMFRREALLDVNGYRISKETRRCEDYDLFMRMYAKGYKGYNLQEKLYLYRIERDSKTKHRPMKYRIDEAVVRHKGYKLLGIGIKGKIYILKPIIIGLIPQFIFKRITSNQY